jgi:vitamin B12 transporter
MRLTSACPRVSRGRGRSHDAIAVSRLGSSALLLATVLLVGPLGGRALAASGASGRLEGSVRTIDGAALPHVVLELQGPRGGRRLTTGPDGTFRVEGLAPGRYAATVDAPGLEVVPPASAVVGPGKETRLDLVLAPAPVREHVLVSATRGEATLSNLGVSADVVDRARIEERAASSLLPLLQDVAGIATARTGGVGGQASAFLRGGEARFVRVLVDGMPVNQPGGAFDFGTALPFELERVEVVRGAASALYGTDALAGVVQLVTRHPPPGEPPSVRGEAEGGRFGWQRYLASTSGADDRFDWNGGAQRLTTDNAEPNSRFDQTAAAAALGFRVDERTKARAVVRFDGSRVGTPGPAAYGPPDLDASFERDDLVVSASVRRADVRLAHQLHVGYARTSQLSLDPVDSGCFVPEGEGRTGSFPYCDFPSAEGFLNRTSRFLAGYQAEASLGSAQLLTAGAEVEHETGAIGDRSADLLRPERTNVGVYAQDRLLLGGRTYLTLGARLESNGSFGTRVVPRAALAFRLRDGDDATTLRASAGLGIKEPSFFESYGESLFAKGNPDLKPERSATVDVGIEQRLFGSRLRAVLTVFDHDYRDEIAYTADPNTFVGTYVNLGRTRARGVEAALDARPWPWLLLDGAYTFLDGEILEGPSDFDPVYAPGRPLLRRPAHQASASARLRLARASLGLTLAYVGARADSDFVGLGLADDPSFRNPSYTRLDARLRVRVGGPVEAFLIGENLLAERYQEVLGYPALPRSLRAGVRRAWEPRP